MASTTLQWLQYRKKWLSVLKRKVQAIVGPESLVIRGYAKEYRREIGRRWKPSTKRKMIEEISTADVVFGSDFHALAQVQRTHRKILRELVDIRKIVLGLEALHREDQKWIDLYLKGKVTEKNFLKKIKWDDKWGFPWENYRLLLEFAKEHRVPVYGLNVHSKKSGKAGLLERDRAAADVLASCLNEYPTSLIYVVYGEFHLAPSHIPAKLAQKFSSSTVTTVTLYLNPENIFFQLAQKGRESLYDVVRFAGKPAKFAVLSSPPWIQWQSYLWYLEGASEASLEEDDSEEMRIDYTEHLMQMATMLRDLLKLDFDFSKLQVYIGREILQGSSLELNLTNEENHIVERALQQGRNVLIPQKEVVLLSRTSQNHIGEVVGQYVHAKLSGRRHMFYGEKDFLPMIWVEAVGYLFSKILNPSRQTDSYEDVVNQLQDQSLKTEIRDSLLITLDQRLSEVQWATRQRSRTLQFRPRNKDSYLVSARVLGGMMGEKLYHGFRTMQISTEELVEWLCISLNSSNRKEFEVSYWKIVLELGRFQAVQKSKKERL